MIEKNINEYKKYFKRDIVSEYIDDIDKLSVDEKINIILNYINKITNIKKQNHYRSKVIDKYARFANSKNEDQNMLYNRITNKKLMCKHYLYSVKISNDNNIYDTMITKFSGGVVMVLLYVDVVMKF